MIDIIGVKRVIIIAVLIGINALLGAVTYLYMIPQEEDTSRRLNALRSEIRTAQSDIQAIQVEFDQLGKQQDAFEELRETGFFKNQTRNQAKDLFEVIQENSGVIAAVASVKSGRIEENPDAQKAKHKILASEIDIDIKAYDDTHIYKYIALVQKNFIGHLSLNSVTMTRIAEVTPEALRVLTSGGKPELVSAKLNMTWRTMIPEDQVITDGTLR